MTEAGRSAAVSVVRRPYERTGWLPATLRWPGVGLVGAALGLAAVALAGLPPALQALVLLGLPCAVLVTASGRWRSVLLGLILLDVPLQLDGNLAYRTEAARLGAIGGLSISLTTVCLLPLYAAWCAGRLAGVGRQPRPRLRESLPAVLYLAFVAASVLAARDRALAAYELCYLLQLLLLSLYVASFVRTRSDVRFVVTVLLAGLALESLIIIGTRLTGLEFKIAGISNAVDPATAGPGQVGRMAGTSGSPNATAAYLTLLLAPALSLLATPLGRRHKLLAAGAFALGTVALLLTLSRGGWLAFVLSVTLLCLVAWRRGWLKPGVPLAAAGVVLLAAVLFQDAIAARLLADDQGSAHSRVPLMRMALRVIGDHPLLGVGANNFALTIEQYATPEFDLEWLYVVHNKYLLVWAESGIGGLVAFLAFLFVTLRRAWRRSTSPDPFLAPLALGLAAALIGHLAHMPVDLFSAGPQVAALWLLAGLITAISSMDDPPGAASPPAGEHRSAGDRPQPVGGRP